MPPSTTPVGSVAPTSEARQSKIFARLPAYNPFVGTFHHAPSAGNRGAVYFSGDIVCVEELEQRKKFRQHPLTGTFHALPGYYDPLHGLDQFRDSLDLPTEDDDLQTGRHTDPGVLSRPLTLTIQTVESPSNQTIIQHEIEHEYVLHRRSSEPIALDVNYKSKPSSDSKTKGFAPIRSNKISRSTSFSPYAVCSPRIRPVEEPEIVHVDENVLDFRPINLDELRKPRAKAVIDENQGFISTGKGIFQLTGCASSESQRKRCINSAGSCGESKKRNSGNGRRLVTSPVDQLLAEADETADKKEYNQSAPRIPANPFIARSLRDDDHLRVVAIDRAGGRDIDEARFGHSSSDDEELLEQLPKPYFIHENTVTEQYKVFGEDQLGDGSYAVVKPAVRKDNGTEVAIKQVHKRYLRTEEAKKAVDREVEIHLRLRHRHIVRLYEVYETDDFLYLVMEKANRGTLKQLLERKRRLPEPMAQRLAHQLLRAVYYLHEHGVLHCDLKPDNVLLSDAVRHSSGYNSPVHDTSPDINPADPHADVRSCDIDIQVCDFGLATKVPDVRYFKHTGDVHLAPFTGLTGTPGYIAPELIRQMPYGKPVDMWGVGVIIFEMLMGYKPYYLPQECLHEPVDFSDRLWQKISPEAKDLVQHLLERDSSKRYTAEQAISHMWFEVSPFVL